ncbi:unnamed protein product [Albugo candida]|uniref:Uncharacterized protein n=1 Tax=Albugo candida TaxID=65357 RepID=A0A024GF70_9STRA|nr:unnamed protein product [Albugo candida]|eukprot:CCI44972.1 unnamed protein product [Albugo candida]
MSSGNRITRNNRYFDIVVDILDRVFGFRVRQSLQNSLRFIPTSIELREDVSNTVKAADEDDAVGTVSSACWRFLSKTKNQPPSRSILMVQIVDAFCNFGIELVQSKKHDCTRCDALRMF